MDTDAVISILKQKYLNAAVFESVRKYYAPENVNQNDLVYVNVHDNRQVALIFIFTPKYYIKLTIGQFNAVRIQQIIQRDIKKVTAASSFVSLHFHGLHDPHRIEVDNYESAVKLQQHITGLREKNHFRQH
jgi:hypothetical protein